jgi:DNA polymerase III subunit gamma/tau
MSYVVLARKYRPRNFAQMVGQEHVVRALTNALEQQRLHHAYLFTGTRGIGKTTVSRILAKSLNCTGPDGTGGITAQPCGVCSACTEIDADRYIDYIELDAASNRSIDEIRDLIERAAYKPSVGRFKVFMIDEAHQLTKDAFNALLKTLEEPPEYLKFVLATTDPERMLPTVLSRCLQFNLRPMAPPTVREYLGAVLAAEGVGHDDGALRLLSNAARGSMRDALSLTDQAIAYGGGQFDEAVVRTMLGAVDGGMATGVVRALAQRDGPAMLALVQQLREGGLSCASTLEQMAGLLQQMAVEQAVPGALPGDDADTAAARELAPLLAPDETQLLYSIALHGREELGLMSDEYAAFTMVLLRYLAFPPADAAAPPPAPAKAAPLRAPAPPALAVPATPPRAAVAPAAVVLPQARPAPTVASSQASALASASASDATPPAPVSPPPEPMADAALGDRWNLVVRRLIDGAALTGLVRELAWQSALVAIAPGSPVTWRLRVEHESLRSAGLRDKLAAAVSEGVGAPIALELQAGAPMDSPAQREAAERTRRQKLAEETIREDPVVRELMSQFKTARIVPGSIKPV